MLEQDRQEHPKLTRRQFLSLGAKAAVGIGLATSGLAACTLPGSQEGSTGPTPPPQATGGEPTKLPEPTLPAATTVPTAKSTELPTATLAPEPTKTPVPERPTKVTIAGFIGEVIKTDSGGSFPEGISPSPFGLTILHGENLVSGYATEKQGEILAFGKWDAEAKKWVRYDNNQSFTLKQAVKEGARMRTITNKKADDPPVGTLAEGKIVALTGKSEPAFLEGRNYTFYEILRQTGIADLREPGKVKDALTAFVADVGLEEVKEKQEQEQKQELYPTAFELPLQAEVEMEGTKIKVDLLLGLTEKFTKETGYKGIELAEPDKLSEVAKMAVYGAYVGWQDDKLAERQNVPLKDWLKLVKEGKAAENQPVVDVSKPNAGIDTRDILPWAPAVDEKGNITLKAGITYAGREDQLPLRLTTEIGTNLLLDGGRLVIVSRFIETPDWLERNYPKFSSPLEIQQTVIGEYFSFHTVDNLSSMFYMDGQAALTHQGNLDLLPFNVGRENFLGDKRKQAIVALNMGNGTKEDVSDDKPIFRLR